MLSNSCLDMLNPAAPISAAVASVWPDEQQRSVADQEDIRRRTGYEANRHRQRLARAGLEAVQSRAHRQQQLVETGAADVGLETPTRTPPLCRTRSRNSEIRASSS